MNIKTINVLIYFYQILQSLQDRDEFANDYVFIKNLLRILEEFIRKSSRDDEDPSSKRRCLQFRLDDAVSGELRLKSFERSKRKRFRNDEDPSSKRRCLVFRREEAECAKSSEQSTRQRFSDDEAPSSKHRCLELWREEKGAEFLNDGVLVEHRLKSSEVSIRQRFSDAEVPSPSSETTVTNGISEFRREEEDDAVLDKPSVDAKDHSSSSRSKEEALAFLLLHVSRGHQTQTQTPAQPQTQTQTQAQPQTQTQAQPQTQTQAQPQLQLQTPQPQLQPQMKLESYDCSVCGKGYSSYQALGGHKASHRIKPPQPFVENAIAEIGYKTRPKMLPPSGKIHKCSICHSVFPTGQALGGHKRRHFDGVLGGHKRNQYSAFLDGGGSESGRDKSSLTSGSVVTYVPDTKQSLLKLIDLNKPASPEFEKDGGEYVEEVEHRTLANML